MAAPNFTVAGLALDKVNAVLGRIAGYVQGLTREGQVSDASLSSNIPRFDSLAWKVFAPVFTAGAGAFSSTNVRTALYAVSGSGSVRAMKVQGRFDACTVTAVTNGLFVDIPESYIAVDVMGTSFGFSDNGALGQGRVGTAGVGLRQIRLSKDVAFTGAWAISAANTIVEFELEFRVRK